MKLLPFNIIDMLSFPNYDTCRALPRARGATLVGPIVAPAHGRRQSAVQRVDASPDQVPQTHGDQGQHLQLREGPYAFYISARGRWLTV